MRAPLYDPGGAACAVLPSASLTASASHVGFRSSITQPACSLSTLQPTVTRFAARLASRCAEALAG